VIIVVILHKLLFAARWNGELSAYFAVGSGVASDRTVAWHQRYLNE